MVLTRRCTAAEALMLTVSSPDGAPSRALPACFFVPPGLSLASTSPQRPLSQDTVALAWVDAALIRPALGASCRCRRQCPAEPTPRFSSAFCRSTKSCHRESRSRVASVQQRLPSLTKLSPPPMDDVQVSAFQVLELLVRRSLDRKTSLKPGYVAANRRLRATATVVSRHRRFSGAGSLCQQRMPILHAREPM